LSHLDKSPFPCKICGKEFQRKDHLLQHEKSHAFTPKMGDKRFETHYPRKRRHSEHSSRTTTTPTTEKNGKGVKVGRIDYQGKICGKEFKRKDHVLQHEKSHAFTPKICDRGFETHSPRKRRHSEHSSRTSTTPTNENGAFERKGKGVKVGRIDDQGKEAELVASDDQHKEVELVTVDDDKEHDVSGPVLDSVVNIKKRDETEKKGEARDNIENRAVEAPDNDKEEYSEMSAETLHSLTCKTCHQVFKHNESLFKHVREFHPGKMYHCKICGKGFGRLDYLKQHVTTHSHLTTHSHVTTHSLFPCKTCGKVCSGTDQLQEHEKNHTNDSAFTCKICGQKFSLLEQFYEHKKSHKADYLPFTSKKANSGQESKRQDQRHYSELIHSSNNVSAMNTDVNSKSKYNMINKRMLNRETVQKPIKNPGSLTEHKKTSCYDGLYQQLEKLKRQRGEEHNVTLTAKTTSISITSTSSAPTATSSKGSEQPFCCDICNQSFKSELLLTVHLWNVHKKQK